MKRAVRTITVLASLAAGIAGFSPALQGAKVPEVDPISKLLRDAGAQAVQISTDASTLKAYAKQGKFDSVSHTGEMERMKGNAQVIMQTAGKLKESRHGAVPWQADVEDKILPLMQELSESATTALAFLGDEAKPAAAADRRNYVDVNYDLSKHLSGLIVNLIAYGTGLDKFESAKRALEARIEASPK